MINLHELNVFVEAALAQNFSVAARRLYLSQPAVSLHIGNLEKQLGMELFRRNGRSIQLSDAGRVLLPLAQDALRQAKHLEETMWGLKGVLIGELSIACSTTAGKYVLPQLVAGFRRCHPQARVSINVAARRTALDWLMAGRADIAVVSAQPGHGEIVCATLASDPIVLIVAADHPWADGRVVSPAELLTQPFISREDSSGTHETLAEGLAAHGLRVGQLDVALTLGSAEAVEMSVEAGIGVAFVSSLAAGHGLALGRVVEVPVAGLNLARQIYVAQHQRRPATPLQQAFWDFALSPEFASARSAA